MGERHIRVAEDYISCDWCRKELKGLRCTDGTDIERIVVGNIQTKRNISKTRRWSSFDSYSGYSTEQVALTGLELDLCEDCKKKFFDHIQSFIPSQVVKNKVIQED